MWSALESATSTMEFSLLLSPPLHSLPTLTLQPIQLWLEKPLGFQSLQSFDHNEFQSLPPPTLCSHLCLRSYKEASTEWRDKERKAASRTETRFQQQNHTLKIKPEKWLGLKVKEKTQKSWFKKNPTWCVYHRKATFCFSLSMETKIILTESIGIIPIGFNHVCAMYLYFSVYINSGLFKGYTDWLRFGQSSFPKNKMCECAPVSLLFSTALSSQCHSDDADSVVVVTFPHCHANISRSLWPAVSLSPIISSTARPPSCLLSMTGGDTKTSLQSQGVCPWAWAGTLWITA